jgi:hypothetical protein
MYNLMPSSMINNLEGIQPVLHTLLDARFCLVSNKAERVFEKPEALLHIPLFSFKNNTIR